mgnify:CR=1 FL=1
MRITKRQLRRIIKEEKALLLEQDQIQVWGLLLTHLSNAAAMARKVDPNWEGASGQEGMELASALEDVWTAFGGERDEIFK